MSAAAAAIQRLSREKKKIDTSRVRDFYIVPLPENIFEWHFTLQGPSDSPYAGGVYHGALQFPYNYPFAPPDIVFFTTSGRFEVGTSICSSISSYHPELWQPAYDVTLVLVALRAFMAQDEERGIGSLTRRYVSDEEKQRLARESHSFECRVCGMRSAGEVWVTQMQGHPPVTPELEAKIPKAPKATANAASASASPPDATEEAPQQQQVAEDISQELKSEVVNAATASNVASGQETEPAGDASASGMGVMSPTLATAVAGETMTTPTTATEPAKSDVVSAPAPRMIRIRFGNRFSFRVSCRQIDHAITICFSVCCAVVLKKCVCG